jgi:hypothetical protein
MFASLALTGAALLFGGAAIGLTFAGVRALVGLFFGAMLGAAVGFSVAGVDGLLFGILGGAVAGTLCCPRR